MKYGAKACFMCSALTRQHLKDVFDISIQFAQSYSIQKNKRTTLQWLLGSKSNKKSNELSELT